MAAIGDPIHRFLVERLDLGRAASLCDLGCGIGATLATAALASPTLRLAGIDRSERAIVAAGKRLDGRHVELVAGELTDPLPWADAAFDRIVCHNVLECLADPAALIEQATRLLTPGGVAVWSHLDVAGFIVHATNHRASQEILDAYAGVRQPWMDHVDPRMGRSLSGLLETTSLAVTSVEVFPNVATERGRVEHRIDEIDQVLRIVDPTLVDTAAIDAWRADLDGCSASGSFFWMEPTVVVTTQRSA